MELKAFQEETLELVLRYMTMVYHLSRNKKISADTKQRLIATALSLLVYAQEELESIENNSTESISD